MNTWCIKNERERCYHGSAGANRHGRTEGTSEKEMDVSKKVRFRVAAVSVWLCALTLNSCATDYVTGKPVFSLVSESREIELGREADPQIVAQYGLYDDADMAAFVDRLGQRMAKVSQRPQLAYTFRVVDSPVINAFALPGGYVYVTRGILAHLNSEDELAGVLGHEIGHVVARHSAEAISRQQLAGIGLGLGSLFSDRFAQFADAAGVGVGLLFLKFGRAQESESDRLGVEYSTRLGYDSHKMAGFFKTLSRMRDEGGQSLPSFWSTHPDPGDRKVKVHELTDQWQGQVPYKPLNKDANEYLRRLDGIVYGEDPRQGYVEKEMFYHPTLKFQFPVPSGWQLSNSASSVQMMSSDKNAMILFTLGKKPTPGEEADDFVSKNQATVHRRETATVHGFSALILESTDPSQNDTLRVLSYFIKKDSNLYVFHGFTAPADFSNHVGALTRVMSGFEQVRDQAVLDKQPRRLTIKPAPTSGSYSSVLKAMGAKEDLLKELAVLNGGTLEDRVEKGSMIKVVAE